MGETTVIVTLALLALGVGSGLYLLWRRPSGAESEAESSHNTHVADADSWTACPHETIENIFGSRDSRYMREKGPATLRRAFRNDRRAIATKWVWLAYDETRRVMAQHFKAARSSPDLSLPLEAKLVAEFLLHQLGCLTLIAVIRLAGPDGLAAWAGAVGKLRHQVGLALEKFPGPADGEFEHSAEIRA